MQKEYSFKIYDDTIKCGSWTFPQSEILDVVLYRTKGLIRGKVLKFNFKDKTYQFGFNPWAKPEEYLKCTFNEEEIKIENSWFSVVLRIALLVYIGWKVIKGF